MIQEDLVLLHITKDIENHKLIRNLGPEPLSKSFNSNIYLIYALNLKLILKLC